MVNSKKTTFTIDLQTKNNIHTTSYNATIWQKHQNIVTCINLRGHCLSFFQIHTRLVLPCASWRMSFSSQNKVSSAACSSRLPEIREGGLWSVGLNGLLGFCMVFACFCRNCCLIGSLVGWLFVYLGFSRRFLCGGAWLCHLVSLVAMGCYWNVGFRVALIHSFKLLTVRLWFGDLWLLSSIGDAYGPDSKNTPKNHVDHRCWVDCLIYRDFPLVFPCFFHWFFRRFWANRPTQPNRPTAARAAGCLGALYASHELGDAVEDLEGLRSSFKAMASPPRFLGI